MESRSDAVVPIRSVRDLMIFDGVPVRTPSLVGTVGVLYFVFFGVKDILVDWIDYFLFYKFRQERLKPSGHRERYWNRDKRHM